MLKIRNSRIYGRGCFTLSPLKARRKIATFAGELVRGKRRIAARILQQQERGVIKVIELHDALAIDGDVGGDATAHINHSCSPNAFMRVVPGERVAFFALRDIEAGEEITMDYRDPDHPKVCECGAEQCRSRKSSG